MLVVFPVMWHRWAENDHFWWPSLSCVWSGVVMVRALGLWLRSQIWFRGCSAYR